MTADVFVQKVLAVEGEGFVAPSETDFWQPLIGDGAFALTRSMVVMVLLTAVVAWGALLLTRRLTVVPSRGQWAFESTYGLVRNGIARDMIGEKHFRPYLPLLFSLFLIILVNNLAGVIPCSSSPRCRASAFPIALALFVYVLYLGDRRSAPRAPSATSRAWSPPGCRASSCRCCSSWRSSPTSSRAPSRSRCDSSATCSPVTCCFC